MIRCPLVALVCGVLGLQSPSILAAAATNSARPILPLDGEWQFRLDRDESGAQAGWQRDDVAFTDTIQVPGAWDAQGFGEPTDKLHHNYVGKAWYKRKLTVPADWAGRRVFLCIGGVHRYADVYVNGTHLGEHVGYLSPFEYDITAQAAPGSEIPGKRSGSKLPQSFTIAIRVDSRQRWDVDALTGCTDIIDEMFTVWGGIWGHVWLEARGPAWLEDLHVTTRVQPARIRCEATIAGDAAAPTACELRILDTAGRTIATRTQPLNPEKRATGFSPADLSKPSDRHAIEFDLELPHADLWTPDTPVLYTARLQLLTGRRATDDVACRFGIREITSRASHFLLNGKRLFLRGYGDDAVYPETMAPPCDKDFYLRRLKLIKSYGFNFVRHHSHMLPDEYYEAADEMGMLVSAEFPIAYAEYYGKAKGQALDLYRSEWAAAIRRFRNHPAIFDWCMSNEMWGGFPLATELYKTAKDLDPLRLVIDADGLPASFLTGTADRPTLDFFPVQFNCHALPLDEPGKHVVAGEPPKPVICHETSNYTSFPRLSAADAFQHNFKPFWLSPIRPKLEKLGLLAEADRWAEQSEKLYLLSHKLNLEDLRKSPRISGYEWWLFQEYWTGTNGLVDYYYRPKSIAPEMVLPFNNSVVLLQDGLLPNLSGGRAVRIKLHVSNYSPQPLTSPVIRWNATLAGKPAGSGTLALNEIGQGELTTAGEIAIDLPGVSGPAELSLQAEMSGAPASCRSPGEPARYANAWKARVYPSQIEPPRTDVPLFAAVELANALKSYGARPIAPSGELEQRAVYVVGQPDLRALDAAARGASLVCLSPDLLLPSVPNRFKPAWWLGNANDCNLGTVVYDHPLTRDVAPDGWCDAGWHSLVEGSRAFVLNDYPSPPQVLIRTIDLHTLCRSKALLCESRLGSGRLIICGLNWHFGDGQDRPECEWLLGRLLVHAAAGPAPAADMPVAWLRQKIESTPLPAGPKVAGFARLIAATEQEPSYMNHRGGNGPLYVCRQTLPGNKVEWETAPVGPMPAEGPIVFVFGGGLGYASQPASAGFSLAVNGHPIIEFNFTREQHVWPGLDSRCSLLFVPRAGNSEDQMGLFYLTLSPDMIQANAPCLVSVTSKGTASRRWFGLTP